MTNSVHRSTKTRGADRGPDSVQIGELQPQQDRTQFLASAFSSTNRRKYFIGMLVWLATLGYFWVWWFNPEHNIRSALYILITVEIFWIHFLVFYFLAFFMNASRSASGPKVIGPYRLAMVVTKTPSEPLSVLKVTLSAMLAQDLPHDTWLADEDPDEETIRWCRENGIFISTRKDCPEYHQPVWPRRTRCKEGNLAYFYDHFGYQNYDIVSQLDADHVPEPTYLSEMVKPFSDPGVGYVSAPSICSRNAQNSWAARMRLYAEAIFHGGLQAGYSSGWAPMCIGSHYAVRTRALQEIGGLGPELAEDHSTSMMMNSGGWRGVHAIDAIARGDGPAGIADLATQEFQWSRSLVTILLRYTPRYLGGLSPKLKFQFLFCQVWYPLFAVLMMLMYSIPIIALVFDIRFVNVTFPAFVGHSIPATIVMFAIVYQIRRDGFFRPYDAKVLSWERTLFSCAQWPWVLWGCATAFYDRITGRFVDFRITPKGETGVAQLPTRVLIPYFVLAAGSLLPVLVVDNLQEAAGFYFLSLVNTFLYTTLFLVIVVNHLSENGIAWSARPLASGLQFTSAVALIALTATSISMRGAESAHALSFGMSGLRLVKVESVVSGAGRSPPGTVNYRLVFEWK